MLLQAILFEGFIIYLFIISNIYLINIYTFIYTSCLTVAKLLINWRESVLNSLDKPYVIECELFSVLNSLDKPYVIECELFSILNSLDKPYVIECELFSVRMIKIKLWYWFKKCIRKDDNSTRLNLSYTTHYNIFRRISSSHPPIWRHLNNLI